MSKQLIIRFDKTKWRCLLNDIANKFQDKCPIINIKFQDISRLKFRVGVQTYAIDYDTKIITTINQNRLYLYKIEHVGFILLQNTVIGQIDIRMDVSFLNTITFVLFVECFALRNKNIDSLIDMIASQNLTTLPYLKLRPANKYFDWNVK